MEQLIRNKKVSILMCFYERPSFLKLIAHNVRTQTFVRKFPSQVELVIADDSVDNMKLDIQALKTELKDVYKKNTSRI